MSLPLAVDRLDVVSGGASDPRHVAGTADPSAGGGVAAPEGSIYARFVAGAGQLWLKTGAAATAWTQVTVGGAPPVQQRFTRIIAQPADGSDFFVTFPVAMAADTYVISPNLVDVTEQVTISCPNAAAGDRTATVFRVITSATLPNASTIEFTVTML